MSKDIRSTEHSRQWQSVNQADTGKKTLVQPISPRVAAKFAAFDGRPAPARDAATIVLLRGDPTAPEVFLMRRQASMKFAARMHVFPGGGLQDSDWDSSTPWLGPPPDQWAGILGCSTEIARALVVGGIRETFEETGVLLAGADDTSVIGTLDHVDELRRSVEDKTLPFARMLDQRGLFLRAELMAPWARWITPEHSPRRFDTRFFVSFMPEGQTVGNLSGEADAAEWRPLSVAIEEARTGEVAMMPPTLHVCRQLQATNLDTLTELAWARPVQPVTPRVVEIDGQFFIDSPAADDV